MSTRNQAKLALNAMQPAEVAYFHSKMKQAHFAALYLASTAAIDNPVTYNGKPVSRTVEPLHTIASFFFTCDNPLDATPIVIDMRDYVVSGRNQKAFTAFADLHTIYVQNTALINAWINRQ